jgi:phosphoserine aminotransferase
MTRSYNFSAGPGALPIEVLEEASKGLIEFTKGAGIQEISHRSPEFLAIRDSILSNLRELMNIPQNYKILLCQGGATLQFTMVPINLLGPNKKCDYLETGIWAQKAGEHAAKIGNVHIIASSKKEKYTYIPKIWNIRPDTSYVHLTSNNTVYGTQIHEFPKNSNIPIVCDMSSDILSRPVDVSQFGLIYAGAQKNLGPSGVVVVIVREDLLNRVEEKTPDLLQYKKYIEYESLYNTPPTFSFYVLDLVLKWVKHKGGVNYFENLNAEKAHLIYKEIDRSGFYKGSVVKEDRSLMNIIFHLPSKELTEKFIKEAEANSLVNLAGYRSVGGIRASTYNAVSLEACQALSQFMRDFEQKVG